MGKLGKAFLFLMSVMLLLTAVSRAAAAFTVAQVQVEQPQARKITHTVTGDGVVEQMRELPVYAPADVLVAEVLVQQGQTVKKGDVLARLDMDSIEERILEIEDEIETLNLQNQAILDRQQKSDRTRSREKKRAKEDYGSALAANERENEEAGQRIEDAQEALEDAMEQAEERTESAYQSKLEELENANDAAEKAYEDAVELADEQILAAKRALEDASKTPAADYGSEMLLIQIGQKQRELEELYRKRREGEEGLDQQIRSLENEVATLRLQLLESENADSRQEEERRLAIARAQEDYDQTVKKYDRIVSEAKEQWDEANRRLEQFLQEECEDFLDDASVKAAEQALAEAKKQEQEMKYRQEEEKTQAERRLEDLSDEDAADTTAEINRILIEEKNRQLSVLVMTKEKDGEIVAKMDETVTQVLITVGQRTAETAAFLMSDTSSGLLFTTVISKEDAEYAVSEDAVILESAGKKFEDLEILSLEANEDEMVTVTVFVPRDTLALGTFAHMEISKQSQEYSVTVPISAVHTENEKHYVFVMEEEDTVLGGQFMAQRVDVTVVEKNGMFAALSNSSLTSESLVIVNSDQMIAAGESVRLKEE